MPAMHECRIAILAALLAASGVPAAAGDAPLLVLRGHTDTVHSVAFRPGSPLIASGSFDGTIRLWRVEGGMASTRVDPFAMLTGHAGRVFSVAFSADGRYLVSGLNNQDPIEDFDYNLTLDDFTPDALRRSGRR